MVVLEYLAGFDYFLSQGCMFLIYRRGYPLELISEYGVVIDHLVYNIQMLIIFGALGYNIELVSYCFDNKKIRFIIKKIWFTIKKNLIIVIC